MKIINKNILEIENGVIVHQVNCLGIMGGGLAKQIKDKWSFLYESYKNFCITHDNFSVEKYGQKLPELLLGLTLPIRISNNLIVANMFAQCYISTNSKMTDYTAFIRCLESLREYLDIYHYEDYPDIYFPYKIGCGLGGGDWNIISKMIEGYFPISYICKID